MTRKKLFIVIGIIAAIGIIATLLILGNAGDDPLKGTSWTRTTEVDSEMINFNRDGHFSYYYGVGSPVDDYDLYDEYRYDSDTKTIILKSIVSDDDRIIRVVSMDESQLVLIIDMEERTFQKVRE